MLELRNIVQETIETFLLSILTWHLVVASVANEPQNADSFARLLAELKSKDTCQTFYSSKLHGFDVQQHTVRTSDGYELGLHRIIHPSDFKTNGPRAGTKKPYLLLHGLIGSSASFVRHIDPKYQAPGEIFDTTDTIEQILKHKAEDYAPGWRSTADFWGASFEGDNSRTLEDLSPKERLLNRANKIRKAPFASVSELDYDGDSINFGREFKQAHRKFQLPRDSKGHITNSLAFTLSNFGYDVWLLNLRGNQYARHHHGRKSAMREDYWDFDIEKLIKEDLMASINHVRQVAQSDKYGPVGLVSYSATSIHVLGLLSQFPVYQKYLQPVIMMAPTMFISTGGKTRYLMKLTSKFVSHNGPFPALGRGTHDKLTKFICQLPLASKLCRLIEMILYGQSKSVRNFLFDDQKSAMVKRDVDCGQTSTAVLHQLLDNLSQSIIPSKYKPFVQARNRQWNGERVRRSVILVHSESDDIASSEEVAKIRDTAVNLLTLVDYVIKEPHFGHTDFLFSKRNQYMVNGEIVRMATLYDYLMYRPSSNQPIERARGY